MSLIDVSVIEKFKKILHDLDQRTDEYDMYLDNSGLKGQFGFPNKKSRTFFIKFMREQFHLEQLLKDRNDLEEILASVKRLENIANDIEIFVYSFGMPVHKKKMQNIYDEILFMPPLPSGFPGGSKYHEAKNTMD